MQCFAQWSELYRGEGGNKRFSSVHNWWDGWGGEGERGESLVDQKYQLYQPNYEYFVLFKQTFILMLRIILISIHTTK